MTVRELAVPGTPEIGRLLDGFVTQANCPGRIALSGRRSSRKRAPRRGPWLVAGPRATGPGLPSTKFGRNSMGSRQETVWKGFAPVRTLAGAELAHIAATLRETKWLVGGRRGAAAQLGLPRTSLLARIQRLGISNGTSGQSHRPLSAVASAPS